MSWKAKPGTSIHAVWSKSGLIGEVFGTGSAEEAMGRGLAESGSESENLPVDRERQGAGRTVRFFRWRFLNTSNGAAGSPWRFLNTRKTGDR